MAACKICGHEDRRKPETWTNWQCRRCERDEMWGSVGCFSREERDVCCRGEHASAPAEETDEEDSGPSWWEPFVASCFDREVHNLQPERASWGLPAQQTQLSFDKQCPRCGAVPGESFVGRNNRIIYGGLDIGLENGEIFGCLCHNCGFSF